MKKGDWLIVRRTALREDSWTYGDWTQYIAFLDDGQACCVRISPLPAILFMIGVCLVLLAGMCAMVPGVDWSRLFALAFVGFLLIGPEVVSWPTGWRLVVVVLTCTRRADGAWTRDL